MALRRLLLASQGTPQGYEVDVLDVEVYDFTSQTPAVAGKLLTMQFLNTNQSGTAFTNTSTLGGIYTEGTYGIVSVPAGVQGAACQIRQNGPIQAFCTSLTSQIVPGNILQADAFGNLCSNGGTVAAGSILAVALGTLTTGQALTTNPIKIPVFVGSA